jgi:hypothetical protein
MTPANYYDIVCDDFSARCKKEGWEYIKPDRSTVDHFWLLGRKVEFVVDHFANIYYGENDKR